MGYYNTVGIAMLTKDYEAMCELAKTGSYGDYALSLILNGKQNAPDRTDEYTLLYWSYIKWGVSRDTQLIIDFLESIEDGHYDFLRIGEETTDFELYYGTDNYLLEYQRDVNFC